MKNHGSLGVMDRRRTGRLGGAPKTKGAAEGCESMSGSGKMLMGESQRGGRAGGSAVTCRTTLSGDAADDDDDCIAL